MGWKDILQKIAPAAVAIIPGAASGVGGLLGLSGTAGTLVGGGALGALTGGVLGGRGKDALLGGALGAAAAGIAPSAFEFFSSKAPAAGAGATEALYTGTVDGAARGWTPGMDGPVEALVESEAPAGTLSQLANASPTLSAPAAEPSFFEKYKTPLLLGGGALALSSLGSETPGLQYTAPTDRQDPQMPSVNFNRRGIAPTTAAPYYSFGTVPFKFFDDNYISVGDEEPGGSAGSFARGGNNPGPGYLSTQPRYFADGLGSGRDDKIEARVSPKEYVMDAETVALAGDGNPDEGARELDKLRQRLRQHKGKALAKGKFSPKAKPLQRYMGGK